MPLSTKYQAPHLPDDYFERNDLIGTLNNPKRCSMVVAASGYGKSSLVAHWLRKANRQGLWINLSSSDDSLLGFIEVLANGLTTIDQNNPMAYGELLNKSEPLAEEELVNGFLTALIQNNHEAIVVLDDYHLIQDEKAHALLTRIIEEDEITMRLVMTSRFDPPLPLFLWNQNGWLNQVRADQLKFNTADTHAFLSTKFAGLDAGVTNQLTDQMDGWITGICLLIYNVSSQEQLFSKVKKVSKDHSHDMMTLTKWYLDQLKSEIKETVLKLSVFNHFSKEMMLSIFPEKQNTHVFDEILRSKLLIISLEGKGDWFRFHHLFQETLIKVAESYFDETTVKASLEAAANYYDQSGDKEQTIKLYIEAGLEEKAIAVFADYRKTLLDQMQWSAFERLYHLLAKLAGDSMMLELSLCWLHIRHGKTQELFDQLGTIEKSIEREQLNEKDDLELFAEYYSLKSYKTYNADQDFDSCLYECDYALAHLTSDWLYPRGYAWVFLLGSMQVQGKMDLVEQSISSAIEKNEVSDFELGYIHFVCCYLYWMELDMYKMRSAAEALIDLGISQNSKELESHGWHFKLLFSSCQGDWGTAFENVHAKDDLMEYAIGVVRTFYQINKANIISNNQGSFDSTAYFHVLFKETYVERNQTQALNIRARIAELEMLQGEPEKACLMLKELGDQPIYPLSNTVDIHLVRANCYLTSGNKEYWQEAFEIIKDLDHFYTKSRNAMGQLYVNIYGAIHSHLKGDNAQAIVQINRALELAILSDVVFPFIEANQHLTAVLNLAKEQTNFTDFIDRIITHRSKRGSTTINISNREKDIINLMIKKLSNKEIGDQLFISEKTVKNHSNSIFKKLGVKNRREAAQRALELSL